MALAEERDQRHRDIVLLERCPDLPLEEFAGFGFERAAALVAPEFLRFPQPPVAVIELLHEPGQPTGAGLGHHHPQFRVPLEDATGEQIDKRLEKIVEESAAARKHAGCLAGGPVTWLHTTHSHVP